MEYGMYRIDKKFLTKIRKRIKWVIDPKLTDLYVGPVLTVEDGWDFFAPVTPRPDDDRIFVSEDGALSGFVHVKRMIPCRSEAMKPVGETSRESEFCMNEDNRRIIEAAALLYEQDKDRREKDGQ